MKLTWLLYASICLIFKGCNEDDQKRADYVAPKILWQTRLAHTGLLRDIIEADIQFNNNALFSGISNSTRSLYFLDIESGNIKWQWNDFFLEDNFWVARYPYQSGASIFIPEGRNTYCIDLNNGETIWRRRIEEHTGGTVACGIGTDYFLLVDFYPNGNGTYEGRVFKGNLLNEDLNLYLTPAYSRKFVHPQNGLVGYLDGLAIANTEGKHYLIIFFGDPNEVLYDLDMYVGLYNLTDDVWVYSKKPSVRRAQSRCSESPIIKNNRIFQYCGFTLVCHELMTGNLCWSKTVQHQGFSVMGWVDNKIVITSQDSKTRCINPEDGSTLWELPTEANPSLIRELNGIAYFIGGGGRFYAIDVSKGRIVWDFLSPDVNQSPPAHFMPGVRIVKSDDPNQPDKVLVASRRNAFCYQAAR
jgi:outer membrane protein assembly factor BamB